MPEKLPWWTWVAPLFLCHLGTQASLNFQIVPGTAIWYPPIAMGFVLIHWWGPRVLLGLYLNAALSAGLWDLPQWWYWPLYAMPETLEVFLSWFLFGKLAKGLCWLPDRRQLLLYLALGIAVPVTVGVPYLMGQFVLFGDLTPDQFAQATWSQWLADVLGGVSMSAVFLMIFTGHMEKIGLSITNKGNVTPIIPAEIPGRHIKLHLPILITLPIILSWLIPFESIWFLYGFIVLSTAI